MASVEPVFPDPAIVVTTPVDITILRIVWLLLSVTYRFIPSVVIPCGYLNLADVPVPFVEPELPADPARVVTAPVDITILRI